MDMALVKEEELIQVLGAQLLLPTKKIDPYEVPQGLLIEVPREVATHYHIFPLKINQAGRLMVASTTLHSREQLDQLEEKLGCPLDLCLTTQDNLSFAIQVGYGRLAESKPEPESWGRSPMSKKFKGNEDRRITDSQLAGSLRAQRQFS